MSTFRNIDLDKLKTNFPLLDFLLEKEGYLIDSNGSRKNQSQGYDYAVLKKKSLGLVLYYRIHESGSPIYKNIHDSSDHGTIIDYLVRHHSLTISEAIQFAYDNRETSVSYEKFQHQSGPNVNTSTETHIISVNPSDSNAYWISRGIDPKLLKHPSISSQLAQVKFRITYHNENRKTSKTYNEPALLHRGLSSYQNYFVKSSQFPKGYYLQTREETLFISKPKSSKRLLIGESTLDLLSYVQLQKIDLDEVTLISSDGRFISYMPNVVNQLIPKQPVLLLNDNDIHGIYFDFLWSMGLANKVTQIGVRRIVDSNKSVIYTSHEGLTDLYLKFRPEHKLKNKEIQLDLPEARAFLNYIHLNYLKRIAVDKCPSKDWNNRLKQSKGIKIG